MWRIGRWSLNGLAAMSLGLCVATVALWIGFSNGIDRVVWRSRLSIYSIFVDHLNIGCSVVRNSPGGNLLSLSKTRVPIAAAVLSLAIIPTLWMRMWISARSCPRARGKAQIVVSTSLGIAGLATLVWLLVQWGPINQPNYFDDPENLNAFYMGIAVPIIALWLAVRDLIQHSKKKIRGILDVWNSGQSDDGICRTCGYDLRATPDRCPECGTVPQKKGNTFKLT
jgi:hypothetical protein